MRVFAGNNATTGPFAPLVRVVRDVLGQKEFNKLRGKAISLHSQGESVIERVRSSPGLCTMHLSLTQLSASLCSDQGLLQAAGRGYQAGPRPH